MSQISICGSPETEPPEPLETRTLVVRRIFDEGQDQFRGSCSAGIFSYGGLLATGDIITAMATIDELRTNRQSAWHVLESAIAKLQALNQRMQADGVASPEWEGQNNAVETAQAAFDGAHAAYLNALRRQK